MKNDVQAVVAIKTNPSRSGRKIDPDCQYDITIYTITRNYYYSIDGVYLYNDSQKLIRRQDKADRPETQSPPAACWRKYTKWSGNLSAGIDS